MLWCILVDSHWYVVELTRLVLHHLPSIALDLLVEGLAVVKSLNPVRIATDLQSLTRSKIYQVLCLLACKEAYC